VNKRLEITLFGIFHSVGAVLLTRETIQAGVSIYGHKKWQKIISNIALDPKAEKLMNEASHTVGHSLRPVYSAQGIAMHGHGFGMEVFLDGKYIPISMVEAENRTLQPSALMRQYNPGDMLAVFWAKRDGAMFFRWEDVDDLNQEEVSLTYDNLAPLLATKYPFDLALDVTWRGKRGRRKPHGKEAALSATKHVFHKAK